MLSFSKILLSAAVGAGLLFSHFTNTPSTPSAAPSLLGRWQVVRYSEQGVQVDKRQPALPQALAVYQHIRDERSLQWYGYFDPEEAGRRARRNFEEWEVRDSVKQVNWVREMIEMPCYVAFFADSTLSVYNKDARTGHVYHPRSWRYVQNPPEMHSFEVGFTRDRWDNWRVQVLSHDDNRLLLFVPDHAEVVELVRVEYAFP